MKKTISFILIAAITLLCGTEFRAKACTGLYIGKKCSADGTVIFGRSNCSKNLFRLPEMRRQRELTPSFPTGRSCFH
ncbi:MAG: hypothetical protein MJY42_01010 [Bacteroidales bacterium]|nr:hypothetical protein [Bacteroidales bacterium]